MSPTMFRWTGEAMIPLPHFRKRCDGEYVVGEVYALAEVQDRSMSSHRHYFAALRSAWENLPEEEAERFPSPEHLRKWALIRCGYSDERSIVCASKAEAQRIAAFVRPMDEYAVVIVREAVVKVLAAQSQSTKAMGRKAFGESKQAVLDCVAGLIGVEPEALAKAEAA